MQEKQATIYLDNASTTSLDSKVLEAMLPYFKEQFGNASSIHALGQTARVAVEKAREQVALFLNCKESEVYFTPSATFSDNLAILGVVRVAQKKGIKPHIITNVIEHPAVLEPIKHLEKTGQIEATFLPVYQEGIVKVEDVERAIKSNTCLVSIMQANNEIGTIQPIDEIAQVIGNFRGPKKYPLFHTDAVQAANYLDLNVEKLGVDLLTLSGHKIYGPKGIGVLYVKQSTLLEPIVFGGHQEAGLIPGTENVANIVGLGKAIELVKSSKLKVQSLRKLRDKLIDGILKEIPQTFLNGSREQRLANNANISFKGVEGEALLILLDQAGIAVSTGSACSSGSLEASHVLMALDCGKERAHSAVRFSLSKNTIEKEIDYVLNVLPKMVEHLRKISGFKV
ncbi:cysteine desulfurase NifS [bacterium (Candidatus Gribaldobacteria) CG10_big_fil_rev_8_21_14_0_10_37_21]|uniref:cysteine desulfurase n=1 Tax=bacterium (Candidatus Gribaldobacteria) CG10_big_fil_rev_8_21_14_0_10_37_21 TaxID=2014275 RepID=A0A2H0UV59_9BACT|nr:MAG: cysteine desulfurase NifS [bacterium (Candidatus Gribaldobacteria) CG10_big_fil_rev_8_21_14_0_10_37_21]